MKKNLKKLDLGNFAGFSLTYSSLKSLYGGAHETKEHGGDFVDNNNNKDFNYTIDEIFTYIRNKTGYVIHLPSTHTHHF